MKIFPRTVLLWLLRKGLQNNLLTGNIPSAPLVRGTFTLIYWIGLDSQDIVEATLATTTSNPVES